MPKNFMADSKRLEDAITAVIDLISTIANTDGSPVVLPKYAITRPYVKDVLGSMCEALRTQGLTILEIERVQKLIEETKQ